jgi:hypothetical protein
MKIGCRPISSTSAKRLRVETQEMRPAQIDRERDHEADQDDAGRRPFKKPPGKGARSNEGDGTPETDTAIIDPVIQPRPHGDGFDERADGGVDHIQDERDEKDRPEPVRPEKERGGNKRARRQPDDNAPPVAKPVGNRRKERADDQAEEKRERNDKRYLGWPKTFGFQPDRKVREINAREDAQRAVNNREA